MTGMLILNEEVYSEYFYTDNDSMTEMSNESWKSWNPKSWNTKSWNTKKIVEKGFHKFIKRVNGQLLKIGFYETNITPGTLIRSAVTGNRYENFLVGSYIEDLFFKVCNTTIETGKRCPIYMFFDSPEEFENHFKCTLSDDIKNKWKHKNLIALKRREESLKLEIL